MTLIRSASASSDRLFRKLALGGVAAAVLALAAPGAFAQEVPPLPSVEGPVASDDANLQHPSRRGPTIGQDAPREWAAYGEPGFYDYVEDEFFISGEAGGAPYSTRIVVRHPADVADFSGLTLLETLHPAQSAQTWMASRVGGMQNGHVYVEVVNENGILDSLRAFNADRYADLTLEGAITEQGQVDPVQNEIIAQVANLLKADHPLGEEWTAENLVITGASYTSGTALRFMQQENGNNAYQTEDGGPLIDGVFAWDTNGPTQEQLDDLFSVPVIILASQSEWDAGQRTWPAESDVYRLYQVTGMPHLEDREMPEAGWQDCEAPLDTFMFNAQVFQRVDNIYEWLVNGNIPQSAERVHFESEETDSPFMVDEYGNAMGGVRSPQTEAPWQTFSTPNPGENFLCGLMGTSEPLPDDVLAELYPNVGDFAAAITAATAELVEAGWFPPEYIHEIGIEIQNFAQHRAGQEYRITND